jgi:hypothetical protein
MCTGNMLEYRLAFPRHRLHALLDNSSETGSPLLSAGVADSLSLASSNDDMFRCWVPGSVMEAARSSLVAKYVASFRMDISRKRELTSEYLVTLSESL